MSTAPANPSPVLSPSKIFDSIAGDYLAKFGPYTFSIVTLLVLWYSIVKPELDKNSLDFDNLRASQDLAIKLGDDLAKTAKVMEQAALSMERTADRYERVMEK